MHPKKHTSLLLFLIALTTAIPIDDPTPIPLDDSGPEAVSNYLQHATVNAAGAAEDIDTGTIMDPFATIPDGDPPSRRSLFDDAIAEQDGIE